MYSKILSNDEVGKLKLKVKLLAHFKYFIFKENVIGHTSIQNN